MEQRFTPLADDCYDGFTQNSKRCIGRSNLIEPALLLRRCEKINVIRFVVGIVHYEIELRIVSLVCICYCYGACSEPVIHRDIANTMLAPRKNTNMMRSVVIDL